MNTITKTVKILFLSYVTLFFNIRIHSLPPDKSKQNLVISGEIKSILILPLYIDQNTFPRHFPNEPDFQPSDIEYNDLSKYFGNKGKIINRYVTRLLEEGSYKLTTFQYNEKNNISSKQVDYQKVDRELLPKDIPGIKISLKNEVILKLIEKYKVDAIYFHYIYSYFNSSQFFNLPQRKYITMPGYVFDYRPIIYNNLGEVIYRSDNRSYDKIIQYHQPLAISFDKYKLQKISNEDLENQFQIFEEGICDYKNNLINLFGIFLNCKEILTSTSKL